MGQIRKINDVYYIEFYARGLLYSQIAGQNIDEARKLLQEVEAKIAGGEALTVARLIELPDFFERFISEVSVKYGPSSVKRFQETIKHFSEFLKLDHPQVHQLAQITPAIMESYKAHLAKNQKPKIVNFTILLIRDILEFGITLGFLNDNPSLHVRLLPWPKTPERKLTDRYDQARELLYKGVSLSKLSLLLKLTDISRTIYFVHLIPLSREDMNRV